MNKKIFFAFIFSLLVTFAFGSQASAIKLKAINTLSIREANLNYDAKDNSIRGIIKVQNPEKTQKAYKLFISFTDYKSGKELRRIDLFNKYKKIDPLKISKDTFNVKNISLPNGKYNASALLEVEGLGVSSVRGLGTINVKSSAERPFLYSLDCGPDDNAESQAGKVAVKCKITPSIKQGDNAKLIFELKPVGSTAVYNKDEFVLPPSFEGEELEFALPTDGLSGGTTDISIQLYAGNGISNISYFRVFLPGDYTRILNLKLQAKDRLIDLYMNGSLYSKDRRLLVGLLDFDKLCFYKDEDLYNISPAQREISYAGATDCSAKAYPFAIVYKAKAGQDKFTLKDIVDVFGIKDKALAVEILNDTHKKEETLTDKFISSGNLTFIAIVVLTLLLFILAFVYAKKKAILLFVFALLPFALYSPSAHAEIFDSLDAPKVRFEVNFPNITKEVGQNDDIIFSFSAIDNFTGGVNKYPGTEVYSWVDNASSTKVKIMDATDSKATVVVNMPNSLSLGVHTLNFEVPASTGICGAAYDFSDFNSSVFDPVPCEFSVDFTVVPGSQVALTFYAQPKAVEKGASSKLYWFSSGANSCVASDGWSGSKALTNTAGADTGAINTDYKDFTLTCSNGSESVSRTDTVYTYVCGDGMCSQWEDCNLCSQDCGTCTGSGASSVSISADPQLIKEGGVSYITWYSNGFTSCDVTEDNPTINDHWNRLAGVEKTSNLNTDTTYTVECSDGTNTMSRSVKVRIVPNFIEF